MISVEKKKRVLHLYFDEQKAYREICKILRMSLRDVTDIIKEAKGEEVSPRTRKGESNFGNYTKIYTHCLKKIKNHGLLQLC